MPQKAEQLGRDFEALHRANAALSENKQLLGPLASNGGMVQHVTAAQNGDSVVSPAAQLPQHGHTDSSASLHVAFATNKRVSLLSSLHWVSVSAAANLDIWPLHEIARPGTKSANSAVPKTTSQQFAENGKRRYMRLAPIQDSDSGARTVLSVNVTPTSPKDLRIPAVVGEQVHMYLLGGYRRHCIANDEEGLRHVFRF
ncbi:hypothetical protein MRX96_052274 [Rhipicephalus microplus]